MAKALVLLMVLGLSACGQKGPLYLPDPPAVPDKAEENGDGDQGKDEVKRRP